MPWGQAARIGTGILVFLVILYLLRGRAEWAIVWLFGLAFGFILQRARFCFASSFRDLFLLHDGRVMKGVLAGMAVAAVGFAFAMYNLSPTIFPGRYPTDANILPLGFHTLFAGFIFAIGMTVAGGCLSGSLYRMGEGYAASWVAMLGILVGFLLLGHTWNFWWDFSYTRSVTVWFPHTFGWVGSVALTLGLILIGYLLVLWWESRSGPKPAISWTEEEPAQAAGFGAQVKDNLRGFFVRSWPVVPAGVALGVLNTFLFFYRHPWGVTSGVFEWMRGLAGTVGIAPGELKGLSGIAGACNIGTPATDQVLGLGHMSMLNIGMIVGAFTAAAAAGEFKLRFPRQKRRYLQALGGGILMGYGAGLALGCTLGGFFSAIPSLALNGWGFGLGLLAGAFVGVKLIRRLG